jgi:tetratricopeptide (TPR) repeat protein
MNRNRFLIISAFLMVFAVQAGSQVAFTGQELGSDFVRGMELFNKEKYPAAIRLFDSYITKNDKTDLLSVTEAEYFRALSALNLFNPDAEYRIIKFIKAHPESPRINEAYLALGDYFYQNKNYRKAVTYYEQVNRQELSRDKLPEYFFRTGYSHYIRGEKPRALLMFSEIKDIDTEYTPPAVYYFSQIAYEEKMYETAMDGFTRLKNDETFGSVVPFYIVQILYLRKDYDQILEIAPDILKMAGKERAVELDRFIGDAYFNKGNYKEALPYLERFATGTKISGREDKYQLGYCYYATGDYDKAIKLLLEIPARTDLLSQNIWYVLGDCYLKKDNKKRAQLGFAEASKLTFDKNIQEDALFNYAKITYETSYSPFGEAVASFQEYINLFPGSDRIEEAYNYLVSAYLQAKNYKAALASLDKIGTRDSKLEEAYQRVAFFRGLELFKNMEMEAAADMFDKSLKYERYNRQMRARAVYWRGEAYYRLGMYENAKADYTTFLGIPGSMLLNENALLRYNLGYSLFNLKDYANAITHLKAFESEVANVKSEVMADARNRIGDCYYITTNYPMAIAYYDKVIDFGKIDADYAMFQKGFSLGLMNDERGKADILTSLTVRYPSSSYVPNAIYERGRAYLVMEDFARGEADFNTIISSYQTTQFVSRAMVQLGLLYYNMGQNEKAIAQYKKVIENYRSTPEARNAMTGLKNAYVDMNDVESYFAYSRTLQGYGDVNLAEKDSMLYASGENLYISGNCQRASGVLESYLREFPNGSFILNAKFYLAECYRSGSRDDDALKLYEAVAGSPNNQFTEQSLVNAAALLYNKEDFKSSLEYYEKLEKASSNSENKILSLKGQLRSSYQLGDARKTITAVDKINSTVNIPEELTREAIFMKAKANYSLNNFDEALSDFRRTAWEVVSSEGAESKYRVAELLFKEGQIDESEKIILEFIDQKSPHQYWMGKIFLLLSDICVKKGDMLQAKVTLESLRDYYSVRDDGILDEVSGRLLVLDQNNQK